MVPDSSIFLGYYEGKGSYSSMEILSAKWLWCWVVVISLGTCTQIWILIKFKGSFKFSLEHLGCLWHLIPLWKSTKRWPRMSPKKILMKVSMIFLTQHIVQLGSGVLTCWTFLLWNTFVTMITSKVKTQFSSNQGKIFLISSRMLCMHSSNLIAW